MKIDLMNCTKFQEWVITTMSTFADGWYNREEKHDITFTINGVEVDFYKWCDRLEFAFDEATIGKARELAIENFSDLMAISNEFQDELDEMQKDLITRIRHKLVLPTWEERFGE